MGKYFSADSDLTKFNVDSSDTNEKVAIPSADNLTKSLSEGDKEKLRFQPVAAVSTPDDHIDMVRVQADEATDMVNKYSRETKKVIEQQFEKFAPAELFEKLNQIIFTMADLSNRISSLEQSILTQSTGVQLKKREPVEITDPEDLYNLQQKLERLDKQGYSDPETIPTKINQTDEVDINELRTRLAEAKSGKVRKIPSDGLIDKSVKLEEVFPNLDDEAYVAAYTAMDIYGKPKEAKPTPPPPGSLRNLNGL